MIRGFFDLEWVKVSLCFASIALPFKWPFFLASIGFIFQKKGEFAFQSQCVRKSSLLWKISIKWVEIWLNILEIWVEIRRKSRSNLDPPNELILNPPETQGGGGPPSFSSTPPSAGVPWTGGRRWVGLTGKPLLSLRGLATSIGGTTLRPCRPHGLDSSRSWSGQGWIWPSTSILVFTNHFPENLEISSFLPLNRQLKPDLLKKTKDPPLWFYF